jgi:hypothetical protein
VQSLSGQNHGWQGISPLPGTPPPPPGWTPLAPPAVDPRLGTCPLLQVLAYVNRVREVEANVDHATMTLEQVESNPVRCPDPQAAELMYKGEHGHLPTSGLCAVLLSAAASSHPSLSLCLLFHVGSLHLSVLLRVSPHWQPWQPSWANSLINSSHQGMRSMLRCALLLCSH